MTRTYTLKGLTCANCAAKIESELEAMEGVSSASVNLMTETLRLQADEARAESVTRLVKTVVAKHEPDVAVAERGEGEGRPGREHGHSRAEGERPEIAGRILGAALFAAAILLSRFFHVNRYVSLSVFLISYLILGGGVVLRALKNIARGQLFDENLLMSAATVGAFILGDYAEAVAVMLFYQIGEYFQDLAVRRSRKSITELMDIRPDFANLIRDGELVRVAPDAVRPGDRIVVKPGERIPLDGVVVEGSSMLDTKALTGEPAPRRAAVSDAVLSGCINETGVLTIEVTKHFGESTVARIIDMVENAAGRKAPAEHFITAFARYYTPAVVGLAALLALLPPLLFGGMWADWVRRGLIFLVISCPCALVVSIPLGFFGGIGRASAKGVLVKGGNYLAALSGPDIVVFDKTGTLTKGVFKVTHVQAASGFSEAELLELAAKAEAFSNHPIARSIADAYGGEPDRSGLSEYEELPGYGVRVRADGKGILAGSRRLLEQSGLMPPAAQHAGTSVYVAVDGVFAGCVVISDEIKPDSQKAVAALKARGVRRTVLLSGDNPETAEAVAGMLGLDEAHGGLLPDQKVEWLERLDAEKRGTLAFVGDGINDAPVLARADVGIAMGGLGSDAAMEAADVVLMTDEPSKLAEAIDIARFTKRVVRQNIVFALGIKGLFLLLGAFGAATMWEAVFADVGVALLAVLNAARVMRAK